MKHNYVIFLTLFLRHRYMDIYCSYIKFVCNNYDIFNIICDMTIYELLYKCVYKYIYTYLYMNLYEL